MQNKCNVLNLLGASSVSNFFRENCTLKILSINSNAFGDDGILLIIARWTPVQQHLNRTLGRRV